MSFDLLTSDKHVKILKEIDLSNNVKRNILDLLIAISNEYKLGKLLVIDIRWSLINLDVNRIEYYTFLAAAT